MREIKFRAWLGTTMEHSVGASQYGHFYCYPDAGDTASFMTTKYPESVPLMQFSGLKDKNGKEVYEGDIVKVAGSLQTVRWLYSGWSIFDNTGEYGYSAEECEVIGNIYENPELLRQEA